MKFWADMEDEPAKCGPLTEKMIVEMCRQAEEDPLGFKAAVYEFTQLCSFGGFRQQEFSMDSKSQIKYYVKPNGDLVVRAFTVSNFLSTTRMVLLSRSLCEIAS